MLVNCKSRDSSPSSVPSNHRLPSENPPGRLQSSSELSSSQSAGASKTNLGIDTGWFKAELLIMLPFLPRPSRMVSFGGRTMLSPSSSSCPSISWKIEFPPAFSAGYWVSAPKSSAPPPLPRWFLLKSPTTGLTCRCMLLRACFLYSTAESVTMKLKAFYRPELSVTLDFKPDT